MRTGLRFTITQDNADQVPAVFDIAKDIGVRRICFYHLVRSGRAAQLQEQGPDPSPDAAGAGHDHRQDPRSGRPGFGGRGADRGQSCGRALSPAADAAGEPSRFRTGRDLLEANGGNRVGGKIACVAWDGTVYPDQFRRKDPLGNVTEKPFKEIWANTADPVLAKLRNKGTFADPRCLKCRWFSLCKGNYRFLDSDPSDVNWLTSPRAI